MGGGDETGLQSRPEIVLQLRRRRVARRKTRLWATQTRRCVVLRVVRHVRHSGERAKSNAGQRASIE